VIALVVEADGIEYARRKGEIFAQEAEEIALALPDTAARAALLELVGYVLDRRW
jgi:geranylgeranyl pyrophosphate synthase